jgi:hypothetical protein
MVLIFSSLEREMEGSKQRQARVPNYIQYDVNPWTMARDPILSDPVLPSLPELTVHLMLMSALFPAVPLSKKRKAAYPVTAGKNGNSRQATCTIVNASRSGNGKR